MAWKVVNTGEGGGRLLLRVGVNWKGKAFRAYESHFDFALGKIGGSRWF